MDLRGTSGVRAGVSLGPLHAVGAVVLDGKCVPVAPPPPGPHALEQAITAVAWAGGPGLRSVTVDLSAVLTALLTEPSSLGRDIVAVRITPRPAIDGALGRSPSVRVEACVAHRFSIRGGHDLRGAELRPLDRDAVSAVADQLRGLAPRHVALVAAGSTACADHENLVAEAVQHAVPETQVSAANALGGHGLDAREATVVLNGALAGHADRVIARCEAALAAAAPGALLRFARGDGGHGSAAQVRRFPVVALGAARAMALTGAAHLAGVDNGRIVVDFPGGPATGTIRDGLPAVRAHEMPGVGIVLTVPTAVVSTSQHPNHQDPGDLGDPVVRSDRATADLICVGAAISRPTAWLDEIAFIESATQLQALRAEVEERVRSMLAIEAAPGSTRVSEMSVVALPYSPAGSVRIRARAWGEPSDSEVLGVPG